MEMRVNSPAGTACTLVVGVETLIFHDTSMLNAGNSFFSPAVIFMAFKNRFYCFLWSKQKDVSDCLMKQGGWCTVHLTLHWNILLHAIKLTSCNIDVCKVQIRRRNWMPLQKKKSLFPIYSNFVFLGPFSPVQIRAKINTSVVFTIWFHTAHNNCTPTICMNHATPPAEVHVGLKTRAWGTQSLRSTNDEIIRW